MKLHKLYIGHWVDGKPCHDHKSVLQRIDGLKPWSMDYTAYEAQSKWRDQGHEPTTVVEIATHDYEEVQTLRAKLQKSLRQELIPLLVQTAKWS